MMQKLHAFKIRKMKFLVYVTGANLCAGTDIFFVSYTLLSIYTIQLAEC